VAGRHIAGVAQGVAANVVGKAVCAGCIAVGLRQTKGFSNPRKWPIWAGLVIGLALSVSSNRSQCG
jgi:predicted Kef-type K+ transport protein